MLSLIYLERKSVALPVGCVLILRSYMSVTLRHLSDELQFGDDDECREFLQSHGAAHVIEKKADQHGAVQFRVKVKEAASIFEGLRQAAFARVDIKGQI